MGRRWWARGGGPFWGAWRVNPRALIDVITSPDPAIRNRSIDALLDGQTPTAILGACRELERFRRGADNLYERVRACMFLFAAYRFYLMEADGVSTAGIVPFDGFEDLLARRFEEALDRFHRALADDGPNGPIFSALAACYHHLAFQTLTDQVRRSVRSSRGNQWMFRVGHAQDHPVRIRRELLSGASGGPYPVLREATPVRLDLSHSGWSDIFFLGMDYPEGARVLNISVDLGVYGRDQGTRPPIETSLRVIDDPVLRLTSVDLQCAKDVTTLGDLFNFGNDYLGLLKAGVIASGLVPPSFEGTGQALDAILGHVVGPGLGLEIVTQVNDIPKGSRLAVSTNLLASLVALAMRATGQTANLTGVLSEQERRLVASRAILGEWLGGSGGGWQDSGGIWPGMKIISGAEAGPDDPEHGVSRGCLLPRHRLLGEDEVAPDVRQRLTESLVLVHGGMAQNVGPILEMVTEKYLLRYGPEWAARQRMRGIFDRIVESLRQGDVHALAACTTENWGSPLKTIIPWVTNRFTETIISRAQARLGPEYWGFLMLGGMSGGGMAFFVAPSRRRAFPDEILDIMLSTKRQLEDALPFAMDPVVYDFQVNTQGSVAERLDGHAAMMPARYYAIQVPELVRLGTDRITYHRRADLDRFTTHCPERDQLLNVLRTIVNHLFPTREVGTAAAAAEWHAQAETIKRENGFDPIQHEQIRDDLKRGRIGLSRNRLPLETDIRDVDEADVRSALGDVDPRTAAVGQDAIRRGQAAVVSLAAGVGSRWTQGAGVVKAASPFVMMDGRHRSFMEIHLAKSQRTSARFGVPVQHVFTTSLLTHASLDKHLGLNDAFGYTGPLYLSPGRSIGHRLYPMARDLLFLWEETPQETLDQQKQKVRDDVRAALVAWAQSKGEGNDYTANVPVQRFNPPGHWYEIPNLLRNGVLARMLDDNPDLQYLMVHNIDSLGTDLDPGVLGMHITGDADLTFEVIPRRIDDRGGGLARVNGKVRLLEGLAQPRESDEFKLRYYNSLTTWVGVDRLLAMFGLVRADLSGPESKLAAAVRTMASRVPTYVTIKDVKQRWGHGQEDIYPVAQFEKLWGDMSGLGDVRCQYVAVPRRRGQQLKDPDQLDPWANDGSKQHVQSLCDFAG